VINVHDLMVSRAFRRRGIGRGLLTEVERIARERGACKLTLEVLDANHPARAAYAGFGFADYGLGAARFLEKRLE
jgi:ribosomal protein S18 acetylase RimI-like enzyme